MTSLLECLTEKISQSCLSKFHLFEERSGNLICLKLTSHSILVE